jgi:hypothetical protein
MKFVAKAFLLGPVPRAFESQAQGRTRTEQAMKKKFSHLFRAYRLKFMKGIKKEKA